MDGSRFDAFTRTFEPTGRSRRKLFLGAVAGLLAATVGLPFAQMAEAGGRCGPNKKKCKNGCCSKNFPVCCDRDRICCKRGTRCCKINGSPGCCRR